MQTHAYILQIHLLEVLVYNLKLITLILSLQVQQTTYYRWRYLNQVVML